MGFTPSESAAESEETFHTTFALCLYAALELNLPSTRERKH